MNARYFSFGRTMGMCVGVNIGTGILNLVHRNWFGLAMGSVAAVGLWFLSERSRRSLT